MKNDDREMNYALFLLARKDYSSKEIFDKIALKFDREKANVVVEELLRRGLISDEQYAVKIIQKYAFTKKYGYLKVEEELRKRGINKDVYLELLNDMYPLDRELENAKHFLRIKPPEKIRFYLLSRGFRFDTVQKLLSGFNHVELT
ncbi:MAG: regulatory protein RecX [Caldisericaceae bacterium]